MEGDTHWMSRRDKPVYASFTVKGEFGSCDHQVDPRFCRVCVRF